MPKKIDTFDFILFFVPLILLAASVLLIYSLMVLRGDSSLAMRQGIFGIIGIAFMAISFFIDYRFFRTMAWLFYGISVVLLFLIEIFGVTINGAKNWFDLGFFNLQPSELAKIFILFALAGFFSDKIGKISWKDILISFLIIMPPLVLILREPDFGTAVILLVIYFSVLMISKPNKWQKWIIFSVLAGLLTIGVLAYQKVEPFGCLMKDYQRSRIHIFMNPSADPLGRGYNVTQSQITIGSGSIMGKGLGEGTQSQLRFLPEPQTDFIFAGAAESFGFVGCFILLGLYGLLIWRIFSIGEVSRDTFGLLICFGFGTGMFFQILINIGMNVGLLPVTGIPLPLFSYGGTSLIVTLFSIGVIQSIFMRHKKINF